MKIEFSALTIKNLKPASKVVEYFDSNREHGQGAFGIRVSPKGRKTWFIAYRDKRNKIKRFTLGIYPEMSLAEARVKANDVMARVREGRDPHAEKIEYKNAETFDDLWQAYIESPRACNKAPATLQDETRKYENILKPAFGDMKIQDITRKHISRVLNPIAAKAPVNANRLYALLSMLFNMAVSDGWINYSPMAGMRKPGGSEKPRQRVLSDEEIKTIWPYLPVYFKLILLTAQRPGEVYAMHSSQIEGDLWIIEKTKTGTPNVVPLSEQAMALIPPWDGYKFPCSRGGSTHIRWTNKKRQRIQEITGIKDWTAHDLRRTARTLLGRLQVPPHVSERILNHRVQGMEAVYNRYDYLPEKREALQKLGLEISRITATLHTDIKPFQRSMK